MKYKLFTLIVVIMVLGVFTSSSTLVAQDDVSILDIETKEAPSESFISSYRSTISAEVDVDRVTTLTAPSKTMNRSSDVMLRSGGWEDPFLPGGGDGWDTSDPGNVGMGDYPLGDASLPILVSMLVLYFLYRGVSSSSKRKNTF